MRTAQDRRSPAVASIPPRSWAEGRPGRREQEPRQDRWRCPRMSWTEVTELVRLAQTGDRVAFGELVERFQGAVYAMALTRVRDPGEAQELAQEVFVHAMRKLPQLRDPRCFAGWLRKITARMAINRLTRRGPVGCGDPALLDTVAGNVEGPPEQLERAEARAE